MNTLASLLALCCLCGSTTGFLWQSPANATRDCQWMPWRTTGRCIDYGYYKRVGRHARRIRKDRDRIPARNGGTNCVGSDTRYDYCNETQCVASTFLDTINTQSRDDGRYMMASRVRPELEFNPCTKPYLDASNNPRMLGKPCKTRKRRRRGAYGNIEVYEEPLKERIPVKIQITSRSKHRDILFLIDESRSVGPLNFKKEVRLAKAIVNNWCGAIAVGKQTTRVGIIGFNTEQHPMLDFNRLFETSQILTHMDTQVTYTSSSDGSTCLFDALEFTRTDMMSSGRGARKGDNYEQVVVLITDGCANCKNQGDLPILLKKVRKKFEKKKIPIIAFFIGNLSSSCKTTMQGLADGALCYQIFAVPNWAELDATSATIEGMECTDSWQFGPPCPQ